MKLVSIIICCFNGTDFIEQCFQCVLQQSYKRLEVIFVDDGSTDDSFVKANSFQNIFIQQGIIFKCLTQQNKGAGGAAAYGLINATGDYICCYDVDDLLFPLSIEKRVDFLNTHTDFAIVRTNGYRTFKHDNGVLSRSLFVVEEEEKNEQDIFLSLLFGRTNNWSGSYMVRSEALWKIYPNHHIIESRYGQNLQLLLAVSYQNKSGFIDEPLMEYQFNPDSFTNKGQTLLDELSNMQGYYAIRLAILKQISFGDKNILKNLKSFYLQKYLDLCLHFDNKELYIKFYNELSLIERPINIYKFHFFRLKERYILSFYFRILNFIENLFSR